MSKTDRDQRGRPHSGKRCPEAAVGGCVYCRTGEYKRIDTRAARHDKQRAIRWSRNESDEG